MLSAANANAGQPLSVNRFPALLMVGLLALAAGTGAYWLWQGTEPTLERRPDIALKDLDGRTRQIAEWDGKLILLNFWATWCPPCLKEIPLLVATQTRLGSKGLQIIGIAMDQADPVRAYAGRLKINYPILVGEAEVAAAMDALGDELGALPFSVLISPDGRILRRVSGDLDEAELQELLSGHI